MRRRRLWCHLEDGRRPIAVPQERRFDFVHGLRFPAALFGLALAIAIGFYPLIRQLTRRLEQLEAGSRNLAKAISARAFRSRARTRSRSLPDVQRLG